MVNLGDVYVFCNIGRTCYKKIRIKICFEEGAWSILEMPWSNLLIASRFLFIKEV